MAREAQRREGYVFPVNGMGLWDAIYGYLAVQPDGNTVIGISWYDQKETPGLGCEYFRSQWQSQFPGKLIFFRNRPTVKTDFKTAPLGIIVVKGKVKEVLGELPKAIKRCRRDGGSNFDRQRGHKCLPRCAGQLIGRS